MPLKTYFELENLYTKYLETKTCPECGSDHYTIRMNTEQNYWHTHWKFNCSECKTKWADPKHYKFTETKTKINV